MNGVAGWTLRLRTRAAVQTLALRMVAGCALTFLACACAFVVFVARFPFVAAVFGLSALGAMVASTATLDGVGAAPISTVLRGPAAVVSPAMCDGLAATVVSAGVLDEPTSGTVREGLAVSIASCSGLGGTAAAATSGVERIAAGSMLGALALSTLMVGAVPAGRLSDDSVGAVAAAALALGFSIAGATSSVRATTAGPRSGRASMRRSGRDLCRRNGWAILAGLLRQN